MSGSDPNALTVEPAPAAVPVIASPSTAVTLNQWCLLQSSVTKDVELLAAFRALEIAAGRTSDAPANFATRYAAITTRATL